MTSSEANAGSFTYRLTVALMLAAVALLVLGGCARGRTTASQSWSGVAVVENADGGATAFIGTKEGRLVQLTLASTAGGGQLVQRGRAFGPPEAEGDTAPAFYGTPTVASGRVFVGGYNGVVYSLNAESLSDERTWTVDGNPLAQGIAGGVVPVETPAGLRLVVAASEDSDMGRLYVLDALSLREHCRYPGEGLPGIGQMWTTPNVVEGIAYFGDHDHQVHAVSIDDCVSRWDRPAELGGGVAASPVIVGNDLYVGAFDRTLYAIGRSNGQPRVLLTAESWFWAGAATDGKRIYAPNLDGRLYIYDIASGSPITAAEFDDDDPILSTPVIVDGRVVVASDSGAVRLLDRNGDQLHSISVGDKVRAQLVAVGDIVYVHALDEGVSAFRVLDRFLDDEWERDLDDID